MAPRKSEGCVGATKSGNGKAPGPDGAKAARAGKEPQEGNATAAQTAEVASTGLLGVGEAARQNPNVRFTALAQYLTVQLLTYALSLLDKRAAVGVDGVTAEQYEAQPCFLTDLHRRLKAGTYRHQPIRRVHIPKEGGATRPIGVSTVEDKVVQQALRVILEGIYECDFLECSYGFRPGRSAHDALRALNRMVMSGTGNWILEADIRTFFDSVDRKMLMEMLRRRVVDGRMLRLVGKCLHVGVLEGKEYTEPAVGTVQGSGISPLLGNIYLHYVLDEWFEKVVRPRLRGRAQLIRYADDFLIGFERRDDAERVMAVLRQRMARFGLQLHPGKTRLIPFWRPKFGSKEGNPATFDFLGFTVFWRRTRKGGWTSGMKTRKARLRRALRAITDYCRRFRHQEVKVQHVTLCQKLQGHFNYFGVNGNLSALKRLLCEAEGIWHKWLTRRSQRSRLTWTRFRKGLLKVLPLPTPCIRVQIWSSSL
jgi:group II intron reverse transcriptase/maturase